LTDEAMIETAAKMRIREAESPEDYEAVKRLVLDYARWFETSFGHDFCFQGIDDELTDLAQRYGKPKGNAWLAEDRDGRALGLIAVKDLGGGACEMKRLWVDPSLRGTGLGRTLASLSIAWAREAGYRVMKLDTLTRMASARSLYASLGFRPCEAYVHNPIDDVIFLALPLASD
jgi:GNAT superfamily N-acetyltransferase